MKRGELWTAAGGSDYANKPRPVLIVQDENFSQTDSITVCPLTSDLAELSYFRVALKPNPLNGLRSESRLMVDKITTIRRTKLGKKIGEVGVQDLARLNQALVVFLGIASTLRRSSST